MEIPTQINVHVPAKGDKFLGDDIGGVQQVKINSHFDRLSVTIEITCKTAF